MTFEEKRQQIAELNPEAKLPVDCDGGLIGYVTDTAENAYPMYEADRTIESLAEGMRAQTDDWDDMEEYLAAADWFGYNTVGTSLPNWPMFITFADDDPLSYEVVKLPRDESNTEVPFESLTFHFFDEKDRGAVTLNGD